MVKRIVLCIQSIAKGLRTTLAPVSTATVVILDVDANSVYMDTLYGDPSLALAGVATGGEVAAASCGPRPERSMVAAITAGLVS